MSKLYEAGGLSTAPTATADKAYCQLWCPTRRTVLREFGCTNPAATGGKIAVKRTTARGTNTTTVLGERQDGSNEAATSTLDLTWSVDATVAGNYLRRAHLPATIGAGIVWQWWTGLGLYIPSGAGVAFVVPTAAAGIALEVWAVWEE
jgi:hypothetical protein